MQTAIGVRFKKVGPIEYYKPVFSSIKCGDWVLAETSRGLECGEVVLGPGEIAADFLQLRSIRRRATQNDLQRLAENKRREKDAFEVCKRKIAEHKLPMKLINVEFTFDVNKIIFSFTADGRVDFRELVRDLAYVFRTRIELRQVGVRDETKLMGGIGNCGRPLCCANFLGDFVAVSIRMAKDQNLSLNPTKISGCCGRLMCCLQYEDENYRNGCNLCARETAINNLNAEEDSAELEKLEQLERAEEKMEKVEADKPIEVRKPLESRNRQSENRRRSRASSVALCAQDLKKFDNVSRVRHLPRRRVMRRKSRRKKASRDRKNPRINAIKIFTRAARTSTKFDPKKNGG